MERMVCQAVYDEEADELQVLLPGAEEAGRAVVVEQLDAYVRYDVASGEPVAVGIVLEGFKRLGRGQQTRQPAPDAS